MKKKLKTISDIFEQISTYLVSIKIDNESLLPMIEIFIPKNWDIMDENFIYDNDDFIVVQLKDTGNAYLCLFSIKNIEKNIDDLVSFTIEVINRNLKIEDKVRKVNEKIKREEELFKKKILQLKNGVKPKTKVLKEETPIEPIIQIKLNNNPEESIQIVEEQDFDDNNLSLEREVEELPPPVYNNIPRTFGGTIKLMQEIVAKPEGTDNG